MLFRSFFIILTIVFLASCAPRYVETNAPIPSTSPFSDIKEGMGMKQVFKILGPPNDQENFNTGKIFIPFYLGSDAVRTRMYYNGLGQIDFGMGALQATPVVNQIIYEPGGPAFLGPFGDIGDALTKGVNNNNSEIIGKLLGSWKGSMQTLRDKIDYELAYYFNGEEISYTVGQAGQVDCKGIATLLGFSENTLYISEKTTSDPGLNCTRYTFAKLMINGNDISVVNYYISGKATAKGKMSRL